MTAPARTAALAAAALACATGLTVTPGSSAAPALPAGSIVAAGNPAVELQGRWDRAAWADTTVNSGSRIFMRFTGRRLAAVIAATARGAQFFSRVDNGPAVLHVPGGPGTARAAGGRGYGPGSSYAMQGTGYGLVNLTPRPLASGFHTVEIDVKDVDGGGDRWSPPLTSAFDLTGFLLDRGARAVPLPAAQARPMLFLGDSITEGIRASGPQIGPEGTDATEDYAWLTGRAFGADFSQVGFGGQGIFKDGDGGVPPAAATLRYNYLGSPAGRGSVPQVVVVNEGTNDSRVRSARFRPAYLSYLRRIRSAWPGALIVALRPFDGTHAADIAAAVKALDDPRTVYSDTAGWIRPDELTDGLHPSFIGHLTVARRLETVIARLTGWRYTPTPAAVCQWLPIARAGATVAVAGSQPQPVAAVRALDGTAAAGAVSPAAPVSQEKRGWAPAYGGQPILAAAPAAGAAAGPVSGRRGWREVRMGFRHPVPVPAAARDLFVYVSVPEWAAKWYEVRLTVSGGRSARTVTDSAIPVAGFVPWARIHVGLGGWRGPLAGLTVEVRGDGPAGGNLPFLVSSIGWTNQPDG